MLFSRLLQLQGTLVLLMVAGLVCRRLGMLNDDARRGLNDLCMDVIIPCNMIKAGMSGALGPDTIRICALLLLAGAVQIALVTLGNRYIFNRCPEAHRRVMQYCTIAAMSGFFGNPIAEFLYGAEGVIYVSVFLIPMRFAMWSVGVAYFASGSMPPRELAKKTITNPGMIGAAVCVLFMLTQWKLPYLLAQPIELLGSCNTPMVMLLIGTFLGDLDLRTVWERDVCYLSAVRLLAIPALAWGLGWALGLRGMALSVSVFMSGAPAGATAPIFAERYHGDTTFAAKCIVFSTLFSLLTMPMWCWLTG